jgi:hypothetical protein
MQALSQNIARTVLLPVRLLVAVGLLLTTCVSQITISTGSIQGTILYLPPQEHHTAYQRHSLRDTSSFTSNMPHQRVSKLAVREERSLGHFPQRSIPNCRN